MFSRFRQLFLKEFLELFRDPRMRVLTFIFPALQIIILAQAFVLELRNVDLAVIDHDNSVLSRELVAEISASGHFNAKFFLQNVSAAEKLL
ncbi:MAG TPA: ABC transporter permease, partial [Candidatus Rifleibacterium sp.]|nr:ABC transporter permease [Candidatus Rifleibacterium sp.]